MTHSVIIVDDEKWIRELVRLSLDWEDLGCKVVGLFEEGQSAITYACKNHPDLIILDVEMPGASGLDVLDSRISDFPCSEVILLSGYSDFKYARHALRRGASDYLLKPLDEKQLEAAVKKALENINRRVAIEARRRRAEAKMGRLETKRLNTETQQSTGDYRIDDVLKMINSSLKFPPTLEQCAESVGLTPAYFSVLFSKIVGLSYVEALRERRIRQSKKLLKSTWMRIGEIAESVGYHNSNYFARVFQQATGQLPSEYRKDHQNIINLLPGT